MYTTIIEERTPPTLLAEKVSEVEPFHFSLIGWTLMDIKKMQEYWVHIFRSAPFFYLGSQF